MWGKKQKQAPPPTPPSTSDYERAVRNVHVATEEFKWKLGLLIAGREKLKDSKDYPLEPGMLGRATCLAVSELLVALGMDEPSKAFREIMDAELPPVEKSP